jgi:TolB protein
MLCAEEIEVALPTRSSLVPMYIARFHVDQKEHDWRFFDELRSVLAFDLENNGVSSVLAIRGEWEETFGWPDPRVAFPIATWRSSPAPYVIAVDASRGKLEPYVFDIAQGTSKKYPEIPLKPRLEENREALHRLADMIQWDLFQKEGVASLKILYAARQRSENGWSSEIWVADSDGANAKPIVSEKGYCMSPCFFPWGRDFFFVSYETGQSKIYRASLGQSKKELLIDMRGSQALPAINQQGNALAFISDVAGRPDLFIQLFDEKGKPLGKARQVYSAPRATQASPTFSPDGKKIAFVSDKDGPPRIYLLDVPGPKSTKRPHPQLLTKANRENTSPAWSLDGTKIAYSAKTDGVRQIWIYDTATGQEWQLTSSPENKENPMWAPDNLHLVYNTESDDICDLYRINLNQREPLLISKGVGQKRFPCWQPKNPFAIK